MAKLALAALLLIASAAILHAAGTDDLLLALSGLCQGISGLLPVAAMLMTVVAAVIYAAGQMMGAETRARANVWATASITGAMIGVLIAAIGPPVLQTVYGSSINCGPAGCSTACCMDTDCDIAGGEHCCCGGAPDSHCTAGLCVCS
jgi:hypothetical protein